MAWAVNTAKKVVTVVWVTTAKTASLSLKSQEAKSTSVAALFLRQIKDSRLRGNDGSNN